jgi:unsaturated rhamnogalacturonyl hydrolase
MNKTAIPIFTVLIFCILALNLHSCSFLKEDKKNGDEKSKPEAIAKKVIDNWLARREIKQYQTDFLNTIHYSEACMALGAARFAQIVKDTTVMENIGLRYQKTIENFDTLPANHVDANVIGLIPLQVYRWNKNDVFKDMGIKMADIQWDNPLPDGLSNQTRYWIDDMYMIGILQIEAYRTTGNPVYLDRAALEYDSYLKKLQQANGLFFHGPEAPFYWGRGNGWVAVALAEIISVLPPDHKNYPSTVDAYCRMAETLVHYQLPNGMWRQLIDVDGAWEESSSTAMFGYAIHIGVSKGILKSRKYKNAYQKAWMVLTNHLTNEGNLSDICAGTGQSNEVKYYLDRPKIEGDLHGQAPLLWFACSLIKEKNTFDQ